MSVHLLQDLVVRIVFILGNLTAKSNQAREQLFKEKESIPTLLSLFRAFHELDLHPKRPAGDGDEQRKPRKPQALVEDVLIKLTRVLANLAIHPGIGPALAADPQVVGLLLATLGKSPGQLCALGVRRVLFLQPARFSETSQPCERKALFCSEISQR